MIRISNNKPCFDHLGNIYGSLKSMCDYWNINPETYTRRINVYHMPIEEALTTPVKHNGGLKCYDHNGRTFRSVTSMCKYWGINRKLFEYRISHGYTLEAALTTTEKKQQ